MALKTHSMTYELPVKSIKSIYRFRQLLWRSTKVAKSLSHEFLWSLGNNKTGVLFAFNKGFIS